jgi:hypothetical protein
MSKSLRITVFIPALLVLVLLAGCELPSGVPEIDVTPGVGTFAPEVEPLAGTEQGEGDPLTPSFATVTPSFTPTPPLEEGPEAAFGPITVESEDFRTLETVTVRLRRGSLVTNVTCTYTIHETAANVVLDAPTSQQIDAVTFEDVFTFSPTQAGTYQVSCTGLATTADGLRTVGVSEAGTPFSVEAKG